MRRGLSVRRSRVYVRPRRRRARRPGVKTLALSHLVPADDPEVTDQMWIDAARTHFRGSVILGKDLLEL